MAGNIRGITVEIGGDTTKLGKAIESSEKQSRSLQVELRQIEKLLKFDPTNTELLTQKQSVLADTISETSKKLNVLKEAEAQVVAQFEKGDIGEDQLRAFQREILKTEKSLDEMRSELTTTETAIKNLANGNRDAVKDTKEFKEAVADAQQELADFGETAGEAFEAIKTGVGILGGATVTGAGYALNLSTEFDKAFNTLITRTGASADEMDSLNEAMTNVYANNFGDSIEDVAQSMATVKTNTKLSGDELQNATERALLLRDTFEFDVNESTRSAKMLMDQYGMSAEEAYNLIAQGAQNGLDKNGDLLDTINEYGVHFSGLGLSAEDMFNMLVNGAENGTFSVDKLGDSVKEFGIRVKDGTADNAFKELGFDVEETKKKFVEGGEGAKESLQKVTTALFNMEDPVKQNQLGVELFGTMWEDLGIDGVKALMNLDGKISESKDALDAINNQKYDDIGSAIQGLGRTLQTDVVEPLGDELKPVVEEAIEYVKSNGPQIKEVISQIVTKIGEFVGFIVDNGPTILSVIAGVGAGFVAWKVASMISGLIGVISSFIGVLKTGSTVMGALNAVMNMNPIVLIVSLIAGLVVAFITLWNTSEGFRNFWINLWENIKSVFSTVINAIVNFFTVTVPNALNTFVTYLSTNVVTPIINFFTVTIPNAWNSFLTFVSTFITNLVNFFAQLPGRIWAFLVSVVTSIATWGVNLYNSAVNAVRNMINSVVNFFNGLPGKIGYALGFVIGKIILFGKNAINWVKTNVPIIINNIVKFFSQLPEKIWTWLVNVVKKIVTWGSNMKSKAVSATTNMISSVINFMKQLPGKIWSAIVGAVSRVATWGSNMKDKATTAVKNLVSNVYNTAKSIPGKVWDAIRGAIDRVTTWGSQMLTKAKTAITNVAKSITDGLKSVPGKIATIGRNIVEGLWNGIKNAGSWIRNKVSDFAGGILDGMKDALGIESPSKAFRDQVGKYIAEGIGVGITKNADYPLEALEALNKDMINQDFDLNEATINRRLRSTFTMGSVNSDPMEDIKTTIREYGERLIEASRRQIVLDTGTLVGETLDKIDKGLATRQTLSARGV